MEENTTLEDFDDTQELEYYDWSYSSSNETSESDWCESLPDISRLKPYNFEPEIPYVENDPVGLENQNKNPFPRNGNVDWCT